MSVVDRPTAFVKCKGSKITYMASGRMKEDNANEFMVNKANIQAQIKEYKKFKEQLNWPTFNQFVNSQLSLWQMQIVEDVDKWIESTCNCVDYHKNYICKHILLQAIRLAYVTVPNTAKQVEFGEKPSRGRPSQITKALVMNPVISSKRKSTVALSPPQESPACKKSKITESTKMPITEETPTQKRTCGRPKAKTTITEPIPTTQAVTTQAVTTQPEATTLINQTKRRPGRPKKPIL